jgi:hypothetical protein
MRPTHDGYCGPLRRGKVDDPFDLSVLVTVDNLRVAKASLHALVNQADRLQHTQSRPLNRDPDTQDIELRMDLNDLGAESTPFEGGRECHSCQTGTHDQNIVDCPHEVFSQARAADGTSGGQTSATRYKCPAIGMTDRACATWTDVRPGPRASSARE